jgi:hypothetical protein
MQAITKPPSIAGMLPPICQNLPVRRRRLASIFSVSALPPRICARGGFEQSRNLQRRDGGGCPESRRSGIEPLKEPLYRSPADRPGDHARRHEGSRQGHGAMEGEAGGRDHRLCI